jgi:hypothetical protein
MRFNPGDLAHFFLSTRFPMLHDDFPFAPISSFSLSLLVLPYIPSTSLIGPSLAYVFLWMLDAGSNSDYGNLLGDHYV